MSTKILTHPDCPDTRFDKDSTSGWVAINGVDYTIHSFNTVGIFLDHNGEVKF